MTEINESVSTQAAVVVKTLLNDSLRTGTIGKDVIQNIQHCRDESFEAVAALEVAALIANKADPAVINKVFSRHSIEETVQKLSTVGRVYLDLDGTALKEGATEFSDSTLETFRKLNNAGVEVCVGPTGKPLAEIAELIKNIPADIKVDIIFEKGAYRLIRGPGEGMTKVYLLTTPEMEEVIGTFRKQFYPDPANSKDSSIGAMLEKEFNIVIVPAGSGKHQSVVSFDVLGPGSPRDYESFTHEMRKALKVSDQQLLTNVETRFKELVETCGIEGLDNARIIHLGNGNIELAPKTIEKDLAIAGDLQARPTICAVAGDSKNDKAMLGIPGVHACLVLYREASLPWLSLVDNFVIGEANVEKFLGMIVAAKEVTKA